MNKKLLETMLQKPEKGSLIVLKGVASDNLLENICMQYCKEDKDCLALNFWHLREKFDIHSFLEEVNQLTITHLQQLIETKKINKIFIERADWNVELTPENLKQLAVQHNIMIFINGNFNRKQWQNCTNYSDRELYTNFCKEEQQKIIEIRSIKPELISIYAKFNRETGKIGG